MMFCACLKTHFQLAWPICSKLSYSNPTIYHIFYELLCGRLKQVQPCMHWIPFTRVDPFSEGDKNNLEKVASPESESFKTGSTMNASYCSCRHYYA